MLSETSNHADNFELTKQYQSHIYHTLNYFDGRINKSDIILDLGNENPLTRKIRHRFGCFIINTDGDLDEKFYIPEFVKSFDKIIYSHTIEHQFNPLNTLERIKPFMNQESKLYILLPDRGKLLWCKGHFHEIDEYRMGLLAKRAGLEIVSKTRQKIWREWWFYFTGIKPLMRLFFEYHAIYELKLK